MIKIVLIILGVIVALMASVCVMGNIAFTKRVKEEAKGLFRDGEEIIPEIVTDEDIEGLPEPVQRYLKYTQIIGKEKIKTVRLKQGGYFRMKENQKWMPIGKYYLEIKNRRFLL